MTAALFLSSFPDRQAGGRIVKLVIISILRLLRIAI